MRSVRALSTIAAVGSFFVIVLGKIVRVTGASTSIPDWPLAFGRLVPEMTPLVFWEWTHRLLVLIVFITMVALIICAARLRGRLWLYCSLSLLMLLVPALIGGLSILRPRCTGRSPRSTSPPRCSSSPAWSAWRCGRAWSTWNPTAGEARDESPRGRPEPFPDTDRRSDNATRQHQKSGQRGPHVVTPS